MKPRLTDKVKHGLWLIVARSATVMEAEAGGMDRDERDAVLAASIFHFGEYTVEQAKKHMQDQGIEVRL